MSTAPYTVILGSAGIENTRVEDFVCGAVYCTERYAQSINGQPINGGSSIPVAITMGTTDYYPSYVAVVIPYEVPVPTPVPEPSVMWIVFCAALLTWLFSPKRK